MTNIESAARRVKAPAGDSDQAVHAGNTGAIRIGSRVQATTPDGIMLLNEPATVIECLDGGAVATAPAPARTPFVRIPNSHLGRIFAAGSKNAAKAIQLLAIKLSYEWDGFVLNERKEGKPVSQRGHAVPRDAFQEGLHHLLKAGVLNRDSQGGRRPRDPSNPGVSKRGRYAIETLAPGGEGGVDIPLTLAAGGVRTRRICGFSCAALLPPKPIRASEAARRIDIVGPVAINGLVKGAVDAGAIAAVRIVGDWMVGRDQAAVEAAAAAYAPRQRTETVIENAVVDSSPVENSPVENSPAHSLSDLTASRSGTTTSSSGRSAKRYSTQPPAAAPEPSASRALADDDVVVLTDWRSAKAFGPAGLTLITAGVAVPEAHVDRPAWAAILTRYGTVPVHLASDVAHQQAMFLVTELRAWSAQRRVNLPVSCIVHGLAAQIAAAVKRRRVIRSFGFIAVNLLQRVAAGDTIWAYNPPSQLPQERLDQVMAHARRHLQIAKAAALPLDERALLGTLALEALSELIPTASAAAELEQRIGTAAPPEAGHEIIGWRYFRDAKRRSAPQPPSPAQAAAPTPAAAPVQAENPAPPEPEPPRWRPTWEKRKPPTAQELRAIEQQERDAVTDPLLRRLIDADTRWMLKDTMATGAPWFRAFLRGLPVAEGELDLLGQPTHAEAIEVMLRGLMQGKPPRGRKRFRNWAELYAAGAALASAPGRRAA